MAKDRLIDDELFDEIHAAGDVTMLMVQNVLVECLHRQAREESRETGVHVSPGEILDKALALYLKEHGKPEAINYLNAVVERYGGRR